jgi:hypothetical protein
MFPAGWLSHKTTVEEAEAAHPGLQDELSKGFPEAAKPFGFQHSEWETLKAEMKPGDELWIFESPSDSWRKLAGRAGVALVRDGTVVKSIVTLMN